MSKVLIMAGGTGGHVIPGITIAKALKKEAVEVCWLGTQNGLESTLVPQADIPIKFVNISGLRGKHFTSYPLAPLRLIYAFIQSFLIIKKFRPDCVIGMGGFVSGPGGFAAKVLGIPLFIHEQNAIVGTTNKILSKLARKAFQAFPNVIKNAVQTGNPMREELVNIAPPEKRLQNREGAIQLLVLGGSRGAVAINQVMPEIAKHFKDKVNVWHQTGTLDFEKTKSSYENKETKIEAFIHDMEKAYAWADLVICRAGALTVSELATVGLASILIPYPYAVDDHQMHNANQLVEKGAAILIKQNELTGKTMQLALSNFIENRKRLLEMSKAAFSTRKTDATMQVVSFCMEICHG